MKYLLTIAMASLLSFQAMAADLKSQDVSQWLTTMPVLKPWLQSHEETLTAHISQPNNPEIVFNESVSALKKAGLYDELNGKVKKLGYVNVEQWTQITQQVTFAWMALERHAGRSHLTRAKGRR